MVIADPNAELVNLVRSMGDPAPDEASPAACRQAQLIRRRFGLSLPTPFVGPPAAEEPIRVAAATDGAAIAAVKWRVFGKNYRGVLPDDFLDRRDVVPPASFWVGRAMVPPSRMHRLFVWGRPGTVHGYVDCGPAHPDDAAADEAFDAGAAPGAEGGAESGGEDAGESSGGVASSGERQGEVWELYVDPTAQGSGGGARLLSAAEGWLDAVGLDRQVLSVLDANGAAQGFYRSQGWELTGRRIRVDLDVVSFDELRFRRGGRRR